MEYSKIPQDIMEYSRSLLFHFILEYSRIFQNVTKYSKVFKNIQKYSKIFENILEYSRIFWNNWKVVPMRYCSTVRVNIPEQPHKLAHTDSFPPCTPPGWVPPCLS